MKAKWKPNGLLLIAEVKQLWQVRARQTGTHTHLRKPTAFLKLPGQIPRDEIPGLV